jgi:hypothetical protein
MKLMDHIKYLSKIGRKGGKATKGISTPAKRKASKENGAEGGAPKIYTTACKTHKTTGVHRFFNGRCSCGQIQLIRK